MNRRDFLKLSGSITASIPLLGFTVGDNKKRSSNSIFTIKQVKTWCNKNRFHYIEDDDIKPFDGVWDNFTNSTAGVVIHPTLGRRIIHLSKFCAYNPTIHNCTFEERIFNGLNYAVIDNRIRYKEYYVHDIIDTTLPEQRNDGISYITIRCAAFGFEDETYIGIQKRLENVNRIFYSIKDDKWYEAKIESAMTHFFMNGWNELC